MPVPAIDALKKLLTACDGTEFEDRRDAAIIRLLADTGPRIGEIAPLKVDAIDFSENTILVLVLWLSALVGVGLAGVYMGVYLQELIAARLPDAAASQMRKSTVIYDLCALPLAVLVYVYISRDQLAVLRGLRKGRRYGEARLARVRSRTLFWGELCAMNTLLFAVFGTVIGMMLLIWPTDLPARLMVHAATTGLMTGASSVAYTFFLSTFYLVRCVYPSYLRHGRTTERDSADLRWLRRRTTVYLAVTASVPLIGVLTGFSFLEPEELADVRDSVLGFCAASGLAFIAVYWLYRKLDADLRALERVV
ncbi:site-specific integrase [Nocardia sp. NPDC060259]|uniref:site-specific integrase n=1 Tax=Nocardia sp. NPDC060259 TaxID=3347088 RepID=UPI00364790DA